MSIRLKHAPRELQGMFCHCEIVQDLYKRDRDDILYDARFRRKEQHNFVAWGEYLADVVDSLQSRRRFGNVTAPPTRPQYQYRARPRVQDPSQPNAAAT